jgi:hypothetical protein
MKLTEQGELARWKNTLNPVVYLVWCFILIDDDSETLSGQPLSACHREWQALSKARNNADGRLASYPEGGPLRSQIKA